MVPLRHFKPGDVIIKEDEMGETAYIIEKGRVEATKEKEGKKAHLGYMVSGEIFGEMSMIDDKPRSATITAVEETAVKEIHRDEFLDILKSDEGAAVKILKVLFNRIRESDVQILQLQAEKAGLRDTANFKIPGETEEVALQASLEGLTPLAIKSLPQNPYRVNEFPFRIGRKSRDPFAHNDLTLPDKIPYQISRHHITIVRDRHRVGILDRRSTLGAAVDGRRIGGGTQDPGPVFIEDQEGILVLGTEDSPFRYKVVVHSTPK